MKKTIVSIVLCMAIAATQASPSNKYVTNEGSPAKKSAPVVRNILSTKLPAKLLTTIKKSYKDYWITALYKEVSNGKVSYHITVENADKIVTLTANPATKWSVTRTVAKDLEAS